MFFNEGKIRFQANGPEEFKDKTGRCSPLRTAADPSRGKRGEGRFPLLQPFATHTAEEARDLAVGERDRRDVEERFAGHNPGLGGRKLRTGN